MCEREAERERERGERGEREKERERKQMGEKGIEGVISTEKLQVSFDTKMQCPWDEMLGHLYSAHIRSLVAAVWGAKDEWVIHSNSTGRYDYSSPCEVDRPFPGLLMIKNNNYN